MIVQFPLISMYGFALLELYRKKQILVTIHMRIKKFFSLKININILQGGWMAL